MYGWRARIGLLIAHPNTIMEPEFNRPHRRAFRSAGRVRSKNHGDGLRDMNQNVERAVGSLGVEASFAMPALRRLGRPHEADRAMAKIEDRAGRPYGRRIGS